MWLNYSKPALIGIAFCMASTTALSQTSEWNPIASEKLIQLPAGYIDRYVEQDFRQSSLAKHISSADHTMTNDLDRIRALKQQINTATAEKTTDLRHQLLMAKSDYLDTLEQKQKLDRIALEKKSKLYQGVLQDILKDQRRSKDPVTAELISNQNAARKRMEHSISVVDEILSSQPDIQRSEYSKQYGENLTKIAELKSAIASHVANAAPSIEGKDVSREEFVRYLLANVESERALLDQEQLMMGYMARLVALDAHALEQQVALGLDGDIHANSEDADSKKLADATDLFID